jgi:hypothetical protein
LISSLVPIALVGALPSKSYSWITCHLSLVLFLLWSLPPPGLSGLWSLVFGFAVVVHDQKEIAGAHRLEVLSCVCVCVCVWWVYLVVGGHEKVPLQSIVVCAFHTTDRD